jgi:hypothetical protein
VWYPEVVVCQINFTQKRLLNISLLETTFPLGAFFHKVKFLVDNVVPNRIKNDKNIAKKLTFIAIFSPYQNT